VNLNIDSLDTVSIDSFDTVSIDSLDTVRDFFMFVTTLPASLESSLYLDLIMTIYLCVQVEARQVFVHHPSFGFHVDG